jgi:Uma2 family endonuclease
MKQASLPRMTFQEFLRWAERQPEGRYELFGGEAVRQSHDGVSMQAETVQHVRVKGNAYASLRAALKAAGASCEVLMDGATVKIDESTGFIPDVLVYCGDRPAPASLTVENPVIVIEVLSEGTAKRDFRDKFEGYASVSSIQHYLILDPEKPLVIHYARQPDGSFLARLLAAGELRLDPPGIAISVGELFE